jgi:DNA-binding CsgD family transcriptional regulator
VTADLGMPDRWPRGRWAWVAGLGVAALLVLTVMDLSQHYRVSLGAVLALAMARALSLALAWLRPRAALVVSLATAAITAAVTTPVSSEEPWPWGTTAAFGQSFVLAIVGARGLGRRELYVYAALRAGASGFLLKHSTPDELAAAVRIVAAGDALLAPSVTRRLVEDFARVQPVVPITPVHLTPRETDVLRLVARGLSNRQIAGELVLAEQTVKTHVSNILTKLDLRDRAQAVVYAYEAGVVVPGPRH